MTDFSLGKMNLSILSEIDNNIKTSDIWKNIRISRFNLAQHIKTLIKYGYLQKKGRATYELTSNGYRALMQHPRGHTPQLNIQTKRLHALGLKYSLKDELHPSFKPKQVALKLEISAKEIEGWKNSTQTLMHIGVTARLTNKSLILYAPELYYERGQPSIVAEARAKAILDREALKLERNMAKFASFKLMRINGGAMNPDALISELVSEEIADEGHPLGEASSIPEEVSKIVLARHPFDKKERLIRDKSKIRTKGVSEIEAVRAESASDDSDIVDEQFNAILEKKLNLLDEQWELNKAKKSIKDLKKVIIRQDSEIDYIRSMLEASRSEPSPKAQGRRAG